MTGQRPASHGVVMNYNTRLDGPTLPGELSRAGYQTHLVGKLHLWPHRKLYGFDSADWSDGSGHDRMDDYERFLRREGVTMPRPVTAHGANINGFVARPWHLDERLHFTNWCADRAIEFLERRDPTVPFFMKVSFIQPHEPCVPPQVYYDRYMGMDLPEPYVGDWARVFDEPQRGLPVAAWRLWLEPQLMKQYRAGYYGCVNHIDDQIYRILEVMPRHTIVVFLSDHGDMIGDHQWLRKRNAFEGSARIPLLMQLPADMGYEQGQVIDAPVELMDVMPTLLEAAGVPIPKTVEGRSVLPLLRGETAWREYLHGECAAIPTCNTGMHYLTDGRTKYIWYPGIGTEQLFDLEHDPQEMVDLAEDAQWSDQIKHWRGILVRELESRPEGFVRDGQLAEFDGPSPLCLPGYERDS
jgi:arylsulfatase A-like enzyme